MGRVWRPFGCRRGMAGKLGMGRRLGWRLRVSFQVPRGLKPNSSSLILTQAWKACSTLLNIAAAKIVEPKSRGEPLRGDRLFAFLARWVVRWIVSFV